MATEKIRFEMLKDGKTTCHVRVTRSNDKAVDYKVNKTSKIVTPPLPAQLKAKILKFAMGFDVK